MLFSFTNDKLKYEWEGRTKELYTVNFLVSGASTVIVPRILRRYFPSCPLRRSATLFCNFSHSPSPSIPNLIQKTPIKTKQKHGWDGQDMHISPVSIDELVPSGMPRIWRSPVGVTTPISRNRGIGFTTCFRRAPSRVATYCWGILCWRQKDKTIKNQTSYLTASYLFLWDRSLR